ncbi:WAP four-disulfide core domain protein 12 [Manduca sexta]|uniref:WAP domain-containing protein n=1 Tax=Manduca sexta TaxID=7130 RepID=A0A921Z2N7_MANSE|nr:WAP four-disulfide core domain protein 12 [Manduca sexta]KAG6450101.1 hypothetical protein O3G_MSEX006414 [Manduca sexta]KAG6450102.1 hypothetical protein O3G_MSEX006414 [Manduca sexta]
MSRYFLIFFLASFVVAMVASMPNDDVLARSAKPGNCPSDEGWASICTNTCFRDSDCPDDRKCCLFGCAHHCVDPDFN